jgi:peptide/nickel transport system permease protein
MAEYIFRRLMKSLLTVFISIMLTFLIIRLMPADPVSLMVDPKLSPEVQEQMRKNFGLDKPIYTQFGIYLLNLLKGDLGYSFKTREPVITVLMQRLPWTILLMFTTLIMSLAIGLPVGITAAKRRNKLFDRVVNVLITLAISIFIPFISFAFLYLFGYRLGLLPTGGAYTPPPTQGFAYVLDVARHSVLPTITLFLGNSATVILYSRNSMIDVLKEDYIRTAFAKGWDDRYVTRKHALKNALIPTVTVTGLMIGSMMGGAIMTETIYAWPGVGRLIYDSVNAMDYPVLQGAFLMLSITVVAMNFITDLVVAKIDPRIRLSGGRA